MIDIKNYEDEIPYGVLVYNKNVSCEHDDNTVEKFNKLYNKDYTCYYIEWCHSLAADLHGVDLFKKWQEGILEYMCLAADPIMGKIEYGSRLYGRHESEEFGHYKPVNCGEIHYVATR